MAIGDIVTAARYNSMRNTLRTVLGTNNSGTDGYGQVVISSAKADTDIVSEQDMIDLYVDLVRTRVHQVGNPPTWGDDDGLGYPETGDIIGEFAAEVGATDSSDAAGRLNKGYVDFEGAVADISVSQSTADSSQMSTEELTSSARENSWNGSITHVVTVTFDGYTLTYPDNTTEIISGTDHRRYFFNTGGKILLSASLTGGTSNTVGSKDYNWSNLLSNMGTIAFSGSDTTASGTGTGSLIGNESLTTSYTTIFTKTGSGVYAENDYTIRAKSTTSNSIQFEISFNDDDSGDPPVTPIPPGGAPDGIDEDVTAITGTTTSTVQVYRANGATLNLAGTDYDGVVIAAPSSVNNSNL